MCHIITYTLSAETHILSLQVSVAVDDLQERHAGHVFQLVWRIDGFYKKFKEAKAGVKPIVFSPSFVTHPNGYRMALSICPYGDGRCKQEFIYIYIYIYIYTCVCICVCICV